MSRVCPAIAMLLVLAQQGSLRAATLTGEVTCDACVGPVAVAAYSGEDVDTDPIAIAWLVDAGAFVLEVPDGAGPIWIVGFDDPDVDGMPAGGPFGAFADNPVDVIDAEPIDGLVLVLVEPPLEGVVLAGTVGCGDCDGAIAVAFYTAPGPPEGAEPGGAIADAFWLADPGPWDRRVPEPGDLWIAAFRDADFDLAPDAGAIAEHADNPVAVADSDVAGLDLVLPALSGGDARVSGTLSCAACTPPIGLVFFGAPGAPDGEVLFAAWLSATGPFSVALPDGLGEVWVYAYHDADLDGIPDLGSELVAYAGNPIDLSAGPVAGVNLTLGGLPEPATVDLRGTVKCIGCTEVIWIEARLPDAAGAELVDRRGLLAPGAFTLTVAEGIGAVHVRASAFDGGPAVEAVPSPITVRSADITGLVIDFGTVDDGTVSLSGTVTCADCAGAIALAAEGPDGTRLAQRWRVAPGPYALTVPANAGAVSVFAWRDADLDGVPDAGTEAVGSPDNPLAVGAGDIGGVDVDLGALPPPGAALSGEVTCDGCPGDVAIALYAAPGPPDAPAVDVVWLPAPGVWSMPLPEASPVWVAAFSDEDRTGAPDPITGLVAYADNPITHGGASVGGIDITLTPIVPPQVAVSGAITCDTCAGIVWAWVLDGPIEGGQVVDDFGLVAAGPFERRYAPGLGEVWFYAFSDADLDREPDPGFAIIGFADNPVTIGETDVDGVVIDLDPDTGAEDEDPEAAEDEPEPVEEPPEEVEPIEPVEHVEVAEPVDDVGPEEPTEAAPEIVEEAAEPADGGDPGCGCHLAPGAGFPAADLTFFVLCLLVLFHRRSRPPEVSR